MVSAPTGQRSMMLAGKLRGQRLLDIGGDLDILAAADQAEFRRAGDLGDEADATRAMDAAGHHGRDQGAEILFLHRALLLAIAAAVETIGHRLVLQIAFAALVADRAIERMVDEQDLHHAMARLRAHRAFGVDHHAVRRPAARRTRPASAPSSASTRHMRQLPAIARRWSENRNAASRCQAAAPPAAQWCRAGPRPAAVDGEFRHRLLRRHRPACGRLVCAMRCSISPAEMPDQPLDRPRRGFAERADRVAFDLLGDFLQHIDFGDLGARPATMRSSTRHIQPVPSRHGVHWPQLSCL